MPGHKVARPDGITSIVYIRTKKGGASASPKDQLCSSPQFPFPLPSSPHQQLIHPHKFSSPSSPIQPNPTPLKHAAASGGSSSQGLSLLLHNLTDLHGRIEELGGAPVQAHGFALVELPLAVVGGYTLLLARLLEAVVGVGHHAHFALHCGNLLLRGGLLASDSEERHC